MYHVPYNTTCTMYPIIQHVPCSLYNMYHVPFTTLHTLPEIDKSRLGRLLLTNHHKGNSGAIPRHGIYTLHSFHAFTWPSGIPKKFKKAAELLNCGGQALSIVINLENPTLIPVTVFK